MSEVWELGFCVGSRGELTSKPHKNFVRVEKACVLVNPGAVDGVWLTPTPQTPYPEANMFGCFRKIVLGLWGLLVSSPLEPT